MPVPGRYDRQVLLSPIGETGQARLADARVLVVGCGALGSVVAESLARAGVGRLDIVDRDVVELTNLHRQTMFDESDAASATPKAQAAATHLHRINSSIEVTPHVADFNPASAQRLARDCDLIIDGTDNFETRFLLNDLAVAKGLPLVYGGAVGTTGTLLNVLPATPSGDSPWEQAELTTPCLRCVFGQAPAPGITPTCDTVGVLGPLTVHIASAQAIESIKILVGDFAHVSRSLRSMDVWTGSCKTLDLSQARREDCPCCGGRQFDYLRGAEVSQAVSLCGRYAVQVLPVGATTDEDHDEEPRVDFRAIADRLRAHGEVTVTPFTLRSELPSAGNPIRLTLFPDGRAIFHGTTDPAQARTLYSRYIGL